MTLISLNKHPWILLLVGGLFGLGLVTPFLPLPQQDDEHLKDSPYLRIDPEKIVLDARDARVPCGECHGLEYETWRETTHATNFDNLHRTEQAQGILDRMGFGLAKRESLCLKCHYTADVRDGTARAIAGVSCESCHGAGRDWINIHNDYGGATHDTETPEHKRMRLQQSEEMGMLRPTENLYAVAANCFECHTVPHERLINEGGHPSGSAFELIDWSEAIRHNFLAAQWSSDTSNREPSTERKRMMYIIGKVLDYEYSMRGVAEATTAGIYSKAMERRTVKARRVVEQIVQLVEAPELVELLRIGRDARLVPDNKEQILNVADQMSAQAQAFTRNHDGSAFEAVDPLVRGETVAVEVEEAPIASAAPESGGTGEGTTEAGAPPTVVSPTGGGTGSGGGATAAASNVVGEVRRRPAWFSSSSHETLGSSGCSCHIDQQNWLAGDVHSTTALRILEESPRSVQIASNYGLSRAQMKTGNQICMSCHGTVITGEEAFEVFDGVSCESCHGPGSGYVATHPVEKYAGSASKGMVQLEQADARANNCARCHHITDERLISSGHPSGAGFDMAERNTAITHWQGPGLSASSLNASYQQATSGRSVPNVPVATVSAPPEPPPKRREPVAVQGTPTTPTRPPIGGGAPPPTPPTPPTGDTAAPAPADGTGAAPVRVGEDTSTEEILLTVKQRLEAIYKSLGRGE